MTHETTGAAGRGKVQSRRIPEKRVNKVKRQTNSIAAKLEKAEKALIDVNAQLAQLEGQDSFSASKVALELNKRSLEAEISNLKAIFDNYQNTYFGYLDKNSKK